MSRLAPAGPAWLHFFGQNGFRRPYRAPNGFHIMNAQDMGSPRHGQDRGGQGPFQALLGR
jgi:hypothetical protein